MKSLILFDGSRTSRLMLQTACEDAYRCATRLKETLPEAHEVLIVAFENVTAAEDSRENEELLASLLETAVQRLECCGDFLSIKGEIIRCRESEATSVLIERAKEWGATSIYLPVTTGPAQPAPARRGWFGFGRKAAGAPAVQSPLTISSECFDIGFLLQESNCRLVLNNPDGTTTRLHYCAPSNPRRSVAKRAAVVSTPALAEATV